MTWRIKTFFVTLSLFIAVGILTPCGAGADEVIEVIDEAVQQYKDGQYQEAAGNLDYASQLIRQKRSSALEQFLPEPLSGWTADPAETQAMGAAMLGGMVSAERVYHQGDSQITVRIATDSPMLQGMMMMFSNPMFAGAQGGRLERIAGQKAIVTYKAAEHSGEVQIMTSNQALVTIEGQGVKKKDLKDYAAAIDYKALAGH